MAIYVYTGAADDVERVYLSDLPYLQSHCKATGSTVTVSGVYRYPPDVPDSPDRVAVVLTEADDVEFNRRWFPGLGQLKFDGLLKVCQGRDAIGVPLRYVPCSQPQVADLPWRIGQPGPPADPDELHGYARIGGRSNRTWLTRVAIGLALAVLLATVIAVATRPWALAGVLPALAIMFYLDRKDRARPESRRALRAATLMGVLSTVPAVALGMAIVAISPDESTVAGALFAAFILAGLFEESMKAALLNRFVIGHPGFDERYDGIVYGARIGLGFALLENVLYLSAATGSDEFVAVFVFRAILAVPGHAIWTALIGYHAARHRLDGTGKGLGGGLALAVLLHGAYDAALMVPVALYSQDQVDEAATAGGIGFLVAICIAVTGFVLFRRASKTALALDAYPAPLPETPSRPWPVAAVFAAYVLVIGVPAAVVGLA
ncbi:MAG: PrsW family intramembrane metalloprotease [Sporichthyaceae bacterium]